ncbi:Bax inhibitor-1 family protein [Burkholderia anthina]|uniref:Bax inhibitor-1/YccA family protein n=1 Tax=Burkholderia anthina TaxID=179879 RepID=UPI0037C1424F
MSNLSMTAGSTRSGSTIVARNAYLLLALSMIPTALAAWFGMGTGATTYMNAHPFITCGGYLGLSFLLVKLIHGTKDTPIGVMFLMVFAAVNGVLLGPILSHVLHNHVNGAQTIAVAAGSTAVVLAVMASIATVTRRNLAGLGSWLFAGLIVVLLGSIANIFLGIHALELALGVVGSVVFAGYMLYDVNRAVTGGAASAVVVALELYLDCINFFLLILRMIED